MSNKDALLLAKIACTFSSRWYDTPEGQKMLAPFLDNGLITSRQAGPFNWTYVNVTPEGHVMLDKASLSALLVGDVTTGSQRAEASLWTWLLIHGSTGHGMGSDYGFDGEIAHILICGLNLNASSNVDDEKWSDFISTYSDDKLSTGISGVATCSCDRVKKFKVEAEVESSSVFFRQAVDY